LARRPSHQSTQSIPLYTGLLKQLVSAETVNILGKMNGLGEILGMSFSRSSVDFNGATDIESRPSRTKTQAAHARK
jgi:hypothetical protein